VGFVWSGGENGAEKRSAWFEVVSPKNGSVRKTSCIGPIMNVGQLSYASIGSC
jgi:hypothetical protein